MLITYGIDLYGFVRGDRPWAQLYRLIARLPRWSHFHASLMDDEEAAGRLLDNTTDEPVFGMLGWTYERELLTTICDLLTQFHATFIQANSSDGKRPSISPLPRPKTALDRLAARRAREAHEARVRMLRPKPE